MQCPACNSDQTQRLEVIYEGGTQDVSATSYTGGAFSASAAKLGLGGAVTATSGVSQTKLAQRVAPPTKKSIKHPILTLVFGPGLAAIIGTGAGNTIGSMMMFTVIAISLAWLVFNIKFNFMDWPALFRDWQAHWYCNKCGTVFKPE